MATLYSDMESEATDESNGLFFAPPLRGEAEEKDECMVLGISGYRPGDHTKDEMELRREKMIHSCEVIRSMADSGCSDEDILAVMRSDEFTEPMRGNTGGNEKIKEHFFAWVTTPKSCSIQMLRILCVSGVPELLPTHEKLELWLRNHVNKHDKDTQAFSEQFRMFMCLFPALRKVRRIMACFLHITKNINAMREVRSARAQCTCNKMTHAHAIWATPLKKNQERWLCGDSATAESRHGKFLFEGSIYPSEQFYIYPKVMFDVLNVDMNARVTHEIDRMITYGMEPPMWLYIWPRIGRSAYPYRVSCFVLQAILEWSCSSRFDWSYRTQYGETFFSGLMLVLYDQKVLDEILRNHPTAYRILTYTEPMYQTTAVQRLTKFFSQKRASGMSGFVKKKIFPAWMVCSHSDTNMATIRLDPVWSEEGADEQETLRRFAKHLRPYTPRDHAYVHWQVQMTIEIIMTLRCIDIYPVSIIPLELWWDIFSYLHVWSYVKHLNPFTERMLAHCRPASLYHAQKIQRSAPNFYDRVKTSFQRVRKLEKERPELSWKRQHHIVVVGKKRKSAQVVSREPESKRQKKQ